MQSPDMNRTRHHCKSRRLLLVAICIIHSAADALSITTFNILAAVHRSVPNADGGENAASSSSSSVGSPTARESERRDLWLPRAEGLAQFVAEELSFSDVVLLQEWWFGREFQQVFDRYTGDVFDRVAEQRPGPDPGTLREDGMAVLVKKKGKLKLLDSSKVRTGPQRIAQVVHCEERSESKRPVLFGNAHLSFPGGPDPAAMERRQAFEAHLLARTLTRMGRDLATGGGESEQQGGGRGGGGRGHMQILAGDFNSNSCAMASTAMESTDSYNFVNCMSAHAEQNLNSIGGPVCVGVTHRTHRGEEVSVDQIFCRLMNGDGSVSKTSLRRLGGPAGTHVVDCSKRPMRIEGEGILSDHMPVTATLHWPTEGGGVAGASGEADGGDEYHPLVSPWNT